MSSFFHVPRSCKQFSCMFENSFHMGKSLMWYNQVKRAGRPFEEMLKSLKKNLISNHNGSLSAN